MVNDTCLEFDGIRYKLLPRNQESVWCNLSLYCFSAEEKYMGRICTTDDWLNTPIALSILLLRFLEISIIFVCF